MELPVSDVEVAKMAALAVRASKPMGMGFLHFRQSDDSIPHTEFLDTVKGGKISIDYHNGRMVKFYARRIEENKWSFDDTITPDYQSWCITYPDCETLALAAMAEE